MQDYSNSVMLALLPTTSDWTTLTLPHVTLVYAGEISDLSRGSFNEMAKDASSLAMMVKPFVLRVSGVDVFGTDEKVNVLRLQPTQELLAMRRFVERWNKSEHPFNPHATMGPVDRPIPSELPSMLGFNKLHMAYGPDSLTFHLSGGYND